MKNDGVNEAIQILVGCGERGFTIFDHGDTSRRTPRSQRLAFETLGLVYSLEAPWPKRGRGGGTRWCPHMQETRNLNGDHFIFPSFSSRDFGKNGTLFGSQLFLDASYLISSSNEWTSHF